MNIFEKKIGQLGCQHVDNLPPGVQPSYLIVLCHGFGAPGDDLVGIGGEVLSRSKTLSSKVRFVFPQGPMDLESMGMWNCRAWWHIDVEKLNQAMLSGDMRDLRKDLPEGLDQARELMLESFQELLEQTNVPLSKIVLGGFSQGSMLGCDIALHFPENILGLVLWSSTLLCDDKWRQLALKRKGLSVLQSHGRQDPLLPYQFAEELKELLIESGPEVEFIPFDGQHEIPMNVLDRFVSWLEQKIS